MQKWMQNRILLISLRNILSILTLIVSQSSPNFVIFAEIWMIFSDRFLELRSKTLWTISGSFRLLEWLKVIQTKKWNPFQCIVFFSSTKITLLSTYQATLDKIINNKKIIRTLFLQINYLLALNPIRMRQKHLCHAKCAETKPLDSTTVSRHVVRRIYLLFILVLVFGKFCEENPDFQLLIRTLHSSILLPNSLSEHRRMQGMYTLRNKTAAHWVDLNWF